ncbi:MAG: glycosyltransferase [Nitrospirae bacterium]|nr:glycosyltransferase [Nitrospirota bacterium]MCL5978927.1 glycosyltransferase [Nitrospirota bacterium]
MKVSSDKENITEGDIVPIDKLFYDIDDACRNNAHNTLKNILDSIELPQLKKQAFNRIIAYYESQALFPAGYSLLFIQWLLKCHDLSSAMEQILKCKKYGITEEKLSGIIYEFLIRPQEENYKQIFNKNIQLLQENKLLFSDYIFEFDCIKKEMGVISNAQFTTIFVQKESKRPFLVDVIDIAAIQKGLEESDMVFLVVFDDLQKFYYLLFFEDLSSLVKYLKQKKVLFFAGDNKILLEDFFSSMRVAFPDYYMDLSARREYRRIISKIIEARDKKISFWTAELKKYYKNLSVKYYRDIFSRRSTDIKVMLITSEQTTLNKFIAKNWHKAFIELGYQSKLLIESEPYEIMNLAFVTKEMYEYMPDIVFHINWTVDSIFKAEEINKNILWITRYRDESYLTYVTDEFDCGNMFILPSYHRWQEDLKKVGVPSSRILYTSDGVDLTIFNKKKQINREYICDVVSVNNSGGNDIFQLDRVLGLYANQPVIQAVIRYLYGELKEIITLNDHMLAYGDIKRLVEDKFSQLGLPITTAGLKDITDCCLAIAQAFYRTKVVEWIMDAGITRSVRVWGNGWSNIEKFKPIHMGTAQHGEQLSEIYRSSKIAISDHPFMSLHERNFEIMASGGFPLIKHTEPENGEAIDMITGHFKEDEEVVLFYNKDDLLNKIQYYLDHPEERERIAENGMQVVINNFSHIAIAKKTMDFIKSYYLRKEQKA